MKRILACILCLSLLICGLSACKDKPLDPPESTTKPEASEENGIKLSRYTIVYPKRSATVVREAAESLAEAMQALTTDTIKIISDDESVKDRDTRREILIGSTNRAASKSYYAETPSFQYHIFKRDSKIILAGYTDALTAEAVTYFMEQYVSKAAEGIISPIADYESPLTDRLTLPLRPNIRPWTARSIPPF